MGHTGYLCILLRDALGGVDQDETYIRTVNGHCGPQNAVFFNVLIHLGALSHAGGINKYKAPFFVGKAGVNGIPGCSGHIGNNDPFLAQNLIHQRGFSRVRLADDSHLDGVIIFLHFLLRREIFHTGIQQIAGAMSVDRRDRNGVAQSQIVKFINIRALALIHLIDRQHHRLSAATEHGGNLLIRSGHARLNITEEHNDRCVVNGNLSLLPHERQNLIVRPGFNTAGIDQREFPSAPIALTVDTIPCNARSILHDR